VCVSKSVCVLSLSKRGLRQLLLKCVSVCFARVCVFEVCVSDRVCS